MSQDEKRGPPNRLAGEKSPYLLQHAHNPVDWYPYGEEAFEKSRREDKPIFLSIGYSTCHWCHVMERESFEDPETARVMNELYVNVKVDREERPDVDQIYMQAVMALTGQGGWPLSIWLTPELKPFYGGTYFPPDARWGRPGFRDVMRHIAQVWATRREDVAKNTAALLDALRRGEAGVAPPQKVAGDLAARAAADLAESFDPRHGGFGGAPKFPRPSTLFFLAHHGVRAGWADGRAMLETTLDAMWRGGIYDHVGGGFARYSTDAKWLVPHFEKMLYDNALLVHAYLDGALWTGREDFAGVVRDVLAFVKREMTDPLGGFYSAQDADSEGEEGRFYVFEIEDLRQALGDDAAFAARLYGASEEGNFEGRNILHWPKSPSEFASAEGLERDEVWRRHVELRQRLYAFRERRVRPGLDDKVLVAWNGLMIGACARAGAVLGEPELIGMAERAATFLWKELRQPDGGLLRRWRAGEARFPASLDDYAAFALGLVHLFEATGTASHLAAALDLAEQIERRFSDPAAPGYFFAEPRDDLIVRMKESYDGALPSGNSLAAMLLARLGAILGRDDLRERGQRVIEAFGSQLERMPEAYPFLLMAQVELEEPPRTLFVVGPDHGEGGRDLLQRAHRDFFPGRAIIPVRDSERAALESLGVPIHGKTAPKGGAAGFLCEQATCVDWP